MEEHDPLLPRGGPSRQQAGRVQKRVDVAVAVRLRLELVRVFRVERESRVVVDEARHLLLLDERHLRRFRAEVVVPLEEVERLRVRIVGGHDRERNPHVFRASVRGHLARRSRLQREDGVNIVLKVARVRRPLRGELHLDAAVP